MWALHIILLYFSILVISNFLSLKQMEADLLKNSCLTYLSNTQEVQSKLAQNTQKITSINNICLTLSSAEFFQKGENMFY